MKTRIAVRTLLAALSLLSGCATHPTTSSTGAEHCAPINETEVAKLFDRWNDALKSGNPDRVVANYTDDALLLATLSNTPLTTHAQIREYFVHFLENHPSGKIDQRYVQIGCNVARDAGLYTFSLSGDRTVAARYTFIYNYINGQWLISHHHSSKMQEG
jgi:uncharacterized protein (TIGR02246 family)